MVSIDKEILSYLGFPEQTATRLTKLYPALEELAVAEPQELVDSVFGLDLKQARTIVAYAKIKIRARKGFIN